MFTREICCVAAIVTSFKSNSSECEIVTDGRGVRSIDSALIQSFSDGYMLIRSVHMQPLIPSVWLMLHMQKWRYSCVQCL